MHCQNAKIFDDTHYLGEKKTPQIKEHKETQTEWLAVRFLDVKLFLYLTEN